MIDVLFAHLKMRGTPRVGGLGAGETAVLGLKTEHAVAVRDDAQWRFRADIFKISVTGF